MHNKTIYIKHNQTRKPSFALKTVIIKKNNKKYVHKVATKESSDFLVNLLDKYEKIKKHKYSFDIVPAKLINKKTIEFPYIEGQSLLEKLSQAKDKKSFEKIIEKYIDLLKSIPQSSSTLTKDFGSIFGSYNTTEKYDVINIGILDFTLENILEDKKGNINLIDYEWTYDFPIPVNYILFRTLLYTYTNLDKKSFFTFDELVEKYIEDKGSVIAFKQWELHFQQSISKNKISKDSIEQLIKNNTEKDREKLLDIKILAREREILRETVENLNTEVTNYYQQDFVQEALEYRSFKQGLIWKGLVIYRRIKVYVKDFFYKLKHKGIRYTFKKVVDKIIYFLNYRKNKLLTLEKYSYHNWISNKEFSKENILKEIEFLDYKPLISIVMPVYNVKLKWFVKAIRSIQKQIYPNWELCIADDASTNLLLKIYLKILSFNKKIKVIFRKDNGHISKASNSALELVTGEFVALMDNDDIIYPNALAEVIKVLNENKDTDLIYSDEDKLDEEGLRVEPFFKPDWSPDLLMSTNYLCHLTVIRKKLIDKVEGFRKGYEGSQDYDLFLRLTDKTNNIEHIPQILYSWRKIPGSTASQYTEKNYAEKTTIKALEDALKRRKIKGEVTTGLFPGSFRVKYDIKGNPLVSILIPTKDKYEYIERCISSLFEKTTYQNIEVVIIDTGSTDKDVLDYYKTLKSNSKIKIIYWKEKFNYSAVNNFGVKNSKGEYILLLNNDTEIISPDWVEGMLEHAQRKEIGAVGVKLFYPNDTIQHAGVVLGINGGTGRGVAGHAFKNFSRDTMGFPVQKDIIKNYSAVTAACLMVSRKKYNEVNGLEEKFRIAFNDVDFNLKLMEKGYYNIYTPYVELYHHESISVGTPEMATRNIEEFGKEIDLMYDKWEDMLIEDPFYNKNLTLTKEDFSIKD